MLYEKVAVRPMPADAPGPAFIVMDLQGIEAAFHKRVGAMKHCEGSLTEVLELLPGYINEKCSATDGLQAYLDRIIEDHDQAEARFDGQVYASAAKMIGEHLIEQFKMLDMYHHDGLCHYLFDRWLDRQSPLFMKVRTEDLFYSASPASTLDQMY
jgi:hypothetical protein